MCVQCMMGAATAVGSANGIRAWLGRRRASWLTPLRLKRITVALFALAIFASASLLHGAAG